MYDYFNTHYGDYQLGHNLNLQARERYQMDKKFKGKMPLYDSSINQRRTMVQRLVNNSEREMFIILMAMADGCEVVNQAKEAL